jgi:hypothetical protein
VREVPVADPWAAGGRAEQCSVDALVRPLAVVGGLASRREGCTALRSARRTAHYVGDVIRSSELIDDDVRRGTDERTSAGVQRNLRIHLHINACRFILSC